MNENLRTGLAVATIAFVSIGGGLLDRWHRLPGPALRPESGWVTNQGQSHEKIAAAAGRREQVGTSTDTFTSKIVHSSGVEDGLGCFIEEKPSDCDSRKLQHEVARFTFWLI
jgi:hypothetical protein